MLNTILILLTAAPLLSQLLVMVLIFINPVGGKPKIQSLIFYSIGAVNGLALVLLGLIWGYLSDAYLVTAGYSFSIMAGLTVLLLVVSLLGLLLNKTAPKHMPKQP
ncbi:hypothetical protein RU97_GL001618 [Enterococcus canis]|uniref:Uncharacterized protein n=1 Tax=Enterococcus canis TaxID=214095 RepID=A0A1L8RGV7_9ENTE|nr:hypothetical protein [Enterococcus canis]OJG19000.1 hypothetical protein RU97_GL001618 [Enterococcus canis]